MSYLTNNAENILNKIVEGLTVNKENKEDTGWIQTHSGIKFYPLAPKQEDINISDIAWGLCHINRFLGHTTSPVSVGVHSIFGAWLIWKLTSNPYLALKFLLHDSPEAYLGDLIRPFKILPEFAFYKPLEENLYAMILNEFELNKDWPDEWNEPQIIKDTDRFMLYLEVQELRNPIHPDNAYMPGNAEHLALKEKLGWQDKYLKYFYELLEKDSKVIYQIFLADFGKYSRQRRK